MTTDSQANVPDVDALVRLIGFDDTHRQILGAHGASIAGHAHGFGQRYFGHLLECAAPAASLLQQLGEPLRLLTDGQQRHHAAMLAQPFDADAVSRALSMGRVHAKLGVDSAFLCALGEVHLQVAQQALPLLQLAAAEATLLREALRKRVQLDMLLQLGGCLALRAAPGAAAPSAAHDALHTLLLALSAHTTLCQDALCVAAAQCGFAAACYALPGGHHLSGSRALLADTHLRAALDQAVQGRMWPDLAGQRETRLVCVPLRQQGKPVSMLVLSAADGRMPADNLAARLDMLGLLAGALLPANNLAPAPRLAEERLAYLSQHDTLTGLPNRSRLLTLLETIAAPSRWVIALAIDDFHEINARLGHEMGDMVLLACANRLETLLGRCGGVGRVGAARFVAYADKSQLAAEDALALMMSTLAEPIELGSETVEIRVCAGIASDKHPLALDAAAQLRCADLALIRARKQGGSGWHYYDEEMDVEIRRLHRLRAEFAAAINHGGLELFFQPKINLVSHLVTGVEALVRWRREDGYVPPGQFFPAIEGSDLMRKLDAWVLAEALCHASRWFKEGRRLSLSVNLSAQTLNHEQFLPMMERLLAQNPLPAGLFEIEVLETLSQQEACQIAHKLERCRDWGIRIALDDFGTGASSLVHLQQLPFDTIKIDQRFVRIMIDAPDNEAIISSMVSYARHSGRRLVAEGIESQAIWQRLLELGCEDGQGYEISPPMSVATLESWLGEWQQQGAAA